MYVLKGLRVFAPKDKRLKFNWSFCLQHPHPLESFHIVMEDISCPFPLIKLLVYAEELTFLEEILSMTVALICHVLLLLVMSFFSLHIKQPLVYFFTFFFLRRLTAGLFCFCC